MKRGDEAQEKLWRRISWGVRGVGLAGLAFLICMYEQVGKSRKGGVATTQHLASWHPGTMSTQPEFLLLKLWHSAGWLWDAFSIRTSWFGILGLIGWAYLAAALVYLVFRNRRLPLAIAGVLMMGLYVADRTGSLQGFGLPGFLEPVGVAIAWCVGNFGQYVGSGFNTSGGIVVAGTILATILVTPDTVKVSERIKFTLWFIVATALLAMVFYKPYLIWKNSGTPAWSLWACCFTATLWLGFYVFGDVLKWKWLTKPFAVAGQNVLFAYLLSEGIVGWMDQAHVGDWYGHLGEINLPLAIFRSLMMGVILLAFVSWMNWLGVRLKL